MQIIKYTKKIVKWQKVFYFFLMICYIILNFSGKMKKKRKVMLTLTKKISILNDFYKGGRKWENFMIKYQLKFKIT